MLEKQKRYGKEFVKKYWLSVSLWAAMISIVPAYWCGREEMITQTTYYYAHISNVTVNLSLTYFLYGMVVDSYTKKYPKWVGWLLWGLGLAVMTLLLRIYGDMKVVGIDK